MTPGTLTSVLARALERGTFRSRIPSALARGWAARARVVRPVVLPATARVVGVSGPTLGGSYKTPTVLALARALVARGERVSVAAHGYGARAGAPFRVSPDDDVRAVGDEALVLARSLDEAGVVVVVGKDRSATLALAAAFAPLVIADALVQTEPRRLSGSLLVVDAEAPWGAGFCPPRGDLRAPPERLLAAADWVLAVRDDAAARSSPASDESALAALATSGRPTHVAESRLLGARGARGPAVPLSELASARVGLVLAIARPDRVVRALALRGIVPCDLRTFGDHAVPVDDRARGPTEPLDVWLTTPKCATKLGPTYAGAPLLTLDHRIDLPASLISAVGQGCV